MSEKVKQAMAQLRPRAVLTRVIQGAKDVLRRYERLLRNTDYQRNHDSNAYIAREALVVWTALSQTPCKPLLEDKMRLMESTVYTKAKQARDDAWELYTLTDDLMHFCEEAEKAVSYYTYRGEDKDDDKDDEDEDDADMPPLIPVHHNNADGEEGSNDHRAEFLRVGAPLARVMCNYLALGPQEGEAGGAKRVN